MLIQSCNKVVPVEFSSEGGTFTLFFKPMSVSGKASLGKHAAGLQHQSTPDPFAVLQFTQEVIRNCLVACEGLETEDGPYQIETSNGKVTDDCLEDMMNLAVADKLMLIGMQMLQGFPVEGAVMHPTTGQPLEGVTVKKRTLLAK